MTICASIIHGHGQPVTIDDEPIRLINKFAQHTCFESVMDVLILSSGVLRKVGTFNVPEQLLARIKSHF